MSTTSFHERINDHKLSFGMVRFSTGPKDNDEKLWRMVVSKSCGSEKLECIDVTISDLVRIKSFCDKAIDCLNTDGGRSKQND